MRRWLMRQSWLDPFLWWCGRHDCYHFHIPLGHVGRLYHD